MVVMIGKNRFGFVAEIHEELNVSRRAQHGTGIKLVSIGGRAFNLADQGLPHSVTLMSGAYGEQSNHADAGHGPEAHGADNRFSVVRHENMFFPRVFFQTFEGFRCPPTYFIDTGIFPECILLHLEERGKINLRRWSNVNHNVYRDASLKQAAS
jgi:hypothetical protein